jgi:hypothetical protein
MGRATHLALVASLSLAGLSSPVGAQTTVVTARQQRFFFRGALGVGYGSFTSATSAGDFTLAGVGALGNFAIGVHLYRGLAVHIDACAMSLVTPTVRVSGRERPPASRADATSTLSIIGGGLTWAEHGGLLWASVSGGVAVLGVEIPAAMTTATGGTTPTFGLTQLGWGLNVLVGKDWPIVYGWRVGGALHGIFAQMADQADMGGSAPTWANVGAGVSLTVSDR